MNSQPRLMTRREFVVQGFGIVAVATTIPSFLSRTSLFAATPSAKGGKVLVVIQLSGGNDGLNTVIPFTQDAYYQARPTLALAKDKVVKLTDELGLHPNLTPLKALYDEGKLSIIQGVGYPNPDRSHFRSMDIWHSAVSEGFESSGWIGRMFDHCCGNAHLPQAPSPTLGISVGETLTPAMNSNSAIGIALQNPDQFFRMTKAVAQSEKVVDPSAPSSAASAQMDFLRRTAMNAELSADRIRKSVRTVQTAADYPKDPFAQGLKLISAMIAGGMDTQVYYISLSGFDTHAGHTGPHERLLKILGDGIAAFQKDLQALGQADRVLSLTFSEFGRRVRENGSRGTDHGQAAPLFVFGNPVKGGIVGEHPSLEQLNNGDLKFHTDFRQVYATVLDNWMGVDSSKVLGQKYPTVPVVG